MLLPTQIRFLKENCLYTPPVRRLIGLWGVGAKIAELREFREKFQKMKNRKNVPQGYMTIGEAEQRWGLSLWGDFVTWYHKRKLGRGRRAKEVNGDAAMVVKIDGEPVFCLNVDNLKKKCGPPLYVSARLLAAELGYSPYMTIYHRLRTMPHINRRTIKRWAGGYYVCFYRKEVDNQVEVWRNTGHTSGMIATGRRIKLFN